MLKQVFGDDLNLKLEDVQLNDLGEVGELVVTKDDCLLMKGRGDQEQVKARAAQIQDEIKNTNSDYEREKFEERLAKLVGGVAVIKVGNIPKGIVGYFHCFCQYHALDFQTFNKKNNLFGRSAK